MESTYLETKKERGTVRVYDQSGKDDIKTLPIKRIVWIYEGREKEDQ